MMKLLVLLLVVVSATAAELAQNEPHQCPETVQHWFKNLPHAKEKLTELHFYFHDILDGKKPRAIKVAQADTTDDSPTSFGLVRVMDDPLTSGPEPNSRIVGFAQGIYASASLEDVGFLMTLNFVFTDGKYNGSTLSVLGHNSVLHEYREMAVVGGSGVFRLARGIATAKTYSFEAATGNAVVEYHVIVVHY